MLQAALRAATAAGAGASRSRLRSAAAVCSLSSQADPAGAAAAAAVPEAAETELRRRVLDKAVTLVPEHGWTRRCVEAGARALDLPETVADMAAPRGGGDLALYFSDACNDRLEASLRARKGEAGLRGDSMSLQLVKIACRERLEMLHPVLPHWPAGLATLTGSPALAADGLARLRRLADDICHHAGDRSADTGWYARRVAVAAVYCSAEAFMLQDASPQLADTWSFLDRRVDGELAALMAAPGLARAACTLAVNMLGLSRR